MPEQTAAASSGREALVAEQLEEQEQQQQDDLQSLRLDILSAASLPHEVNEDKSITIGPLPLKDVEDNETSSDSNEEREHLVVEEQSVSREQRQEQQLQQDESAAEESGDEDAERSEGSRWASEHASDGLPFVLAGLGVVGLCDADDEPGLTSEQLQVLITRLQVALSHLVESVCESGPDHDRDDDQRRSTKRHRAMSPELAPHDQELLDQVEWYRCGQVRALRHAIGVAETLHNQVQQAEQYASDDEEYSGGQSDTRHEKPA